MGAGKETKRGAVDTPGFPLRQADVIEVDPTNGRKKLVMRRNDRRLTQCSTNMLQCWRANCNIQVLIYDSNPDQPDPEEIARVTDYIMSYQCKGNLSTREGKDVLSDAIMK